MIEELDETTIYLAVVNHEDQYSIWPAQKAIPEGWRADGKSGRKTEVLEYISQVWADMRPLSIRQQLENLISKDQTIGNLER